MATLGMGNALVDILLKLENDQTLQELGMAKGAMDMIDENQMRILQKTQCHLEQSQSPGGSVCNTMRAISKLGGKSGFIGKIGEDEVGCYYEKALQEAGVSPFFVKTKGISGVSTILISPDGERTMGTFLGPAPTLTPEDVTESILQQFNTVYIEGYLLVNEELVRTTLQKAKRLGLRTALDLSNFNIVNAFKDFLAELIPQYVDILFSNESEAEAFTGMKPEKAIEVLSEMVDISVVTLGKEGALIRSGNETVHVPTEGGKPIDTTGAGDHFAAGFLYGRSLNASLEQSARIGSLLAEYVIKEVGPQISNQYWGQIKLKVEEILR